MLHLLTITITVAICVADEVKPVATVTAAPSINEDESRLFDRDRRFDRGYSYREDHDDINAGFGGYGDHDFPSGPVIFRTIDPHGRTPNIALQNKIISDVYSPDYAQPTVILDYRYLKTSGRDYTRGPGGQILILPKGIHTNEPKEFKNYDELIEHLRLKNIAEQKAMREKYGMHDDDDRQYYNTQQHYEMGQNPYRTNAEYGQRIRQDWWKTAEHRH